MELPTKAPPRCLPAPAIFAVVPPALPGQGTGSPLASPAPWAWAAPEGHRPQVGIGAGVEGVLKLLGVHLAILVQNVGVDLGDHVDLSVARVALGGL